MTVSSRKINVFKDKTGSYYPLGNIDHREDIKRCIDFARRGAYGTTLDTWSVETWEQLLADKRIFLVVIEEVADAEQTASSLVAKDQESVPESGKHRSSHRLIGFNFVCFITNTFYDDLLKHTREPPLAMKLFQKHLTRHSPILTPKQMAEKNKGEGLNIFSFMAHEDKFLETPEGVFAYAATAVDAFTRIVSGYKLKSLIGDFYSKPSRLQTEPTGLKIENEYSLYYLKHSHLPENHRFFMAHMSQDLLQNPKYQGTLAYYVSHYKPPALRLTRLQRETLEFTLEGADATFLEQCYGLKPGGIGRRFSDIFDRVEKSRPADMASVEKIGRAKLLKYVRDHLQLTFRLMGSVS